ncbi:hypothetical protein M2103_000767 [Ereboglobus sp. PH5-5]|uniref:hypothetical protein n=1 Tax=unclassified Ereboglobus TaxID=2626932 RepID=UPI002407052D|nr:MULTISPECIES: hypothetical protein [unclassified Ereboglobus]MDF9827137.1 hypothetical protein [Ereboglobus sp. PH5-10]MDF9832557.1 hypothetical protein [Ereboglobus sp. PH5-5]
MSLISLQVCRAKETWTVEIAAMAALTGNLCLYDYQKPSALVISGRNYVMENAKEVNRHVSDMLDGEYAVVFLKRNFSVPLLAVMTEKNDPDGSLALVEKYRHILNESIQRETLKTAPEDMSTRSDNANLYLTSLMAKKETVDDYLYIRLKAGINPNNEYVISFYLNRKQIEEYIENPEIWNFSKSMIEKQDNQYIKSNKIIFVICIVIPIIGIGALLLFKKARCKCGNQ